MTVLSNDYAAMNEVCRHHCKEGPPARSALQVAKLQANAVVEIEAIALVKKNCSPETV
jgi:2-iminobutanoate/2-iminopropanoate deaminase